MSKIYLEKNVYEASLDRINYIFAEFEHVYVSFSGGKDSSLMIQLTNQVAQKLNRKFDVLFIDLEAQYKDTITHVNELKELSNINTFYHIALPLNLMNSNSIFQTHWVCWGEEDKDKWVREMPEDAISDIAYFPFFKPQMEFEEFIEKFPFWYKKKHHAEKVACLVGIRADESYNRFRSIAFGKKKYKDLAFITDNGRGSYSGYPIYDYSTEDVWGAVFKNDFKYNYAYELLNKNGVSIHQQRMCQPYGADQRVSLDQWAVLEPDTWHKIVNRVSGANYGALYAKQSLLGHNGSEKPNHLTWEEYAIFLLETTGMYSRELMMHYVGKIKAFMVYYNENYNVELSAIEEELKPSEIQSRFNEKQWIHWKRIAKMVEKNDFAGRTLSYGLTKKDEETARNLKEKWGRLLGIEEHTTKPMKQLAKNLGYETN